MAKQSSISKNMLLLQHFATMTPVIVTEIQEQVTRFQEEKERADRLQEQVTRLQETQIESKAPVSKYISEEELKKDADLTHSKIQKCEIRNPNGDLISDNTTYIGICRDIWDSMESKKKIKKHTTFNYKDQIEQKEPIGNGFKWCKEADLYIQDQNANKTFLEILNMVKVQLYTIEISIQLKDSDKNDIKKIYYKNFP